MGTVGRLLCGLGVALVLLAFSGEVEARGGGFRGRSFGPGLGSNPRSHTVRPYTRRDGLFVPPHSQSNPNKEWRDNWSTKPNVNPYTGREGSRINPPQPRR
jgi:hypothetical protein